MSNKLEIDRDRIFTNGYRKYLQSLTHGALVDFILNGSNLSFTPAQERSLLLEELVDEKTRHDRATKKINTLVHENRGLREQIEALQSDNTAGSHATGADLFAAIFGGLQTEPVITKRIYLSFDEYVEAHPEAVAVATIGAIGQVLSEAQIDACDQLMDQFDLYTEAGAIVGTVGIVQIACTNQVMGDVFVTAAQSAGITPVIFATYVLNHLD